MQKSHFGTRLVSAILSVMVLVGLVPVSASAAAVQGPSATVASVPGSYAAPEFDNETYTFGTAGNFTAAKGYTEGDGYGWRAVQYPTDAYWDANGIYQSREPQYSNNASNVTDNTGYAAIPGRSWRENEMVGDRSNYFFYVETSTLVFDLDAWNYDVTVTFTNPTGEDYVAGVMTEDVVKGTVTVPAGGDAELTVHVPLIDGQLNMRLYEASTSYTDEHRGDAAEKQVYLKAVDIAAEEAKVQAGNPTIYLASDSTVQSYAPGNQEGWGQRLASYFGEVIGEVQSPTNSASTAKLYTTTNVQVDNVAIGGRSVRYFYDEGRLDEILLNIEPGDYLFVQWGHNDASTTIPQRYVSPEDFGGWLQVYIDGALQRGATPVLVSPVAQRGGNTFPAYRNVMYQLCQEQGVPFLDLGYVSSNLLAQYGEAGTNQLYVDGTHFSNYGASKMAMLVAQMLANYNDPNNAESSIYYDTSEYFDEMKVLGDKVSYYRPDQKPGGVDDLAVASTGASTVSLTWSAATDADIYYIYRQEVGAGEDETSVVFDDSSEHIAVSLATSFDDSGLDEGTSYVYAVRAFNEKGIADTFSNKVLAKTKAAAYRFDFQLTVAHSQANRWGTPVLAEGWAEVNETMAYNAETGYGWIGTLPSSGRYRGPTDHDLADVVDDFIMANGLEFAVDLAPGDYELTMYAGDMLNGGSVNTNYNVEGIDIGGTNSRPLGTFTKTVTVLDGQLNIGFSGDRTGSSWGYINGMTITPILAAPEYLEAYEYQINSNASMFEFRIRFDQVDEATSFNVYRKSMTDDDFALIRTIPVEAFGEELTSGYFFFEEYRGETYEFYVTAVREDGYESAPSPMLVFDDSLVLDEGVTPPSVPTGLTSTSVSKDGGAVLTWDANLAEEGIFYYNIYRAREAESRKGFRGWEKLGSSTSNTYTDNDPDMTANIHYYYQVQAVNLGGPGEKSGAYETPITETLNPYPAEDFQGDRALVAVNLAGDKGAEYAVTATDSDGNPYESGVFLSWRVFEEDPDGIAFDVYRNGTLLKDNIPVSNIVDEGGTASHVYEVVKAGQAPTGRTVAVWDNYFMEMELYVPGDQQMPDGSTAFYHANDMSVGDLDGDGTYELVVKWMPNNQKDNSGYGYTGTTIIDAYDVDWNTGAVKLLWRVDLGINIRSGAHYTQFQVWDFDGDGKAELAVKTADGSTIYVSQDGTDQTLAYNGHVGAVRNTELPTGTLLGSANHDYRNANGFILDGPEYFTMFRGDGSIIDTVDYLPARGSVDAWGDGYGNRVDRFLSATAYLDGEKAYAVFTRGYYTRTGITAYELVDTNGDGVGDEIEVYWTFDTDVAGTQYESQGNHAIAVVDLDGDGKDEIIFGALVIDHDGSVIYSTGLGHGDAQHTSDWVSWNDGLEIMSVHEHASVYSVNIRDAETGEILMGWSTGASDVGRGVASDIDPTSLGGEFWASDGPLGTGDNEWYSKDGGVFSTFSRIGEDPYDNENLILLSQYTPAANFTLYWTGDLLADIQDHDFESNTVKIDGTSYTKDYRPVAVELYTWDYDKGEEVVIFRSEEVWTSNGTKGNLGLVADVLGDWREEIIARHAGDITPNSLGGYDVIKSANDNKVRVYTTTVQTDYVVPTMMQNRAYREGIAWQNVGYNQPAHTDYLLSEGLVAPTLWEEDVTTDSVELLFNEASDGVRGHDVVGYEILRSEDGEEYTSIAEIRLDELVPHDGPSNGGGDEDDEPEYEWVEGDSIQFDFGTKSGSAAGFEVVTNQVYEAGVQPYGYLGNADDIEYSNVNSTFALQEGDDATLGAAINDTVRQKEELVFAADVAPGKYKVDVYAAINWNVGWYTNGHIELNGEEIGVPYAVDGGTPSQEELRNSGEVVVGDDGRIEVRVYNDTLYSGQTRYALLNAVVITELVQQLVEPEEPEEPEEPGEEEVIARFDFGNRYTATPATGFTPITMGAYDAQVTYGWVDTSFDAARYNVVGSNNTDILIDVQEGDDETLIAAVNDGVRADNKLAFQMDVEPGRYRIEVYAAALLTANNTFFGDNDILVNGDNLGSVEVNANKPLADYTFTTTVTIGAGESILVESISNKGALAVLNAMVVTRLPESNSGGNNGGNTIEDGRPWFTYTDTGLESDKTYYYRASAIVDTVNGERAAHLSKTLTVRTLLDVAEALPLEDVTILQDYKFAAGEGLLDLLPEAWPVKTSNGDVDKKATITNWDTSEVDLTMYGSYTAYATIRELAEPLELTVVVERNTFESFVDPEVIIVEGADTPMPTSIQLTLKNGDELEADVTWTNWDEGNRNIVDEYDITGVLSGYSGIDGDEIEIRVLVVQNYVASYSLPPRIEIDVDTDPEDILALLPETVVAQFASGVVDEVEVDWDTSELAGEDTSEPVTFYIEGKLKNESIILEEAFDGTVSQRVVVNYPVAYQFDFGTTRQATPEGYIAIGDSASYPRSQNGVQYGYIEGSGAPVDDKVTNEVPLLLGDENPDLLLAVRDGLRAGVRHLFQVDLAPGEYVVEVYSYALSNNSYYSNSTINVNGEDIGGGITTETYLDEIPSITTVTIGEEYDENLLLNVYREGTNAAGHDFLPVLNAVVIRRVGDAPEPPVEPDITVEGYDEPTMVTTYTGVVPTADKLPGTVTVYLSNGETEEAAVAWKVDELDVSTAQDAVLYGTLPEYEDYQVQMVVRVLQDAIASVETLGDITVPVGTEAGSIQLPETVQVTYLSGRVENPVVAWQDISSLSFEAATLHTVTGTIDGYAEPITLRIRVVDDSVEEPGFLAIESVTAEIYTGQTPALPETVTVILTDNSKVEGVPVAWSLEGVSFDVPGNVDVPGVIQIEERGIEETVYARVTVKADVALSVDSSAVQPVTVANGASNEEILVKLEAVLPVTYQSGRVVNEPVAWTIELDSTVAGPYVVWGTVAGFPVSVTVVVEEAAEPVDFTALEELYEKYAAIEQGDYTDLSWQKFQIALQNAADLLENRELVTQAQVLGAIQDLEIAFFALEQEPEPGPNDVDIISVTGDEYTGKGSLAVVLDSTPDDFVAAYVNGVLLQSSDYTVVEGSLVFTLAESYLATLQNGEYLLTIALTGDRFANVGFTVALEEPTPGPGPGPDPNPGPNPGPDPEPGDGDGDGTGNGGGTGDGDGTGGGTGNGTDPGTGGETGTDGANNGTSTESPIAKTGDENGGLRTLWVVVAALALCGMAAAVVYKVRKRGKKDEV